MKLLSWNVNGIRAAHRNGFLRWFESQDADIICLQETKAHREQLDAELLHPLGYHSKWHSAEKRGYSGVATYSRRRPLVVHEGIGDKEIDREGRVLVSEYRGFVLINAYFPNSQHDHGRLGFKLRFCRIMLRFLNRLRRQGKKVVICGDYNIAHKEIDLRNPRENRDNAGFLPEERTWMDRLVKHGYIDCFRHFCAEPGHYTWWSYRVGVRKRNIGWRIDHFFVSPELRRRLKNAYHQPTVMGSDHCPIGLELR
jgi:exodeoxyribonuclease-3